MVAAAIVAFENSEADSAAVNNVMAQAMYGMDPGAAITPRDLVLLQRAHAGGRYEEADAVARMVEMATRRLGRHSPIYALHILRTWMSSWAATQRTQGGASPCPWACPPIALDSQAHLLRCQVFREAIAEVLGSSTAEVRLHLLGLGNGHAETGAQLPTALNALALAAHSFHKRHKCEVASQEAGRRLAMQSVRFAHRHLAHLK